MQQLDPQEVADLLADESTDVVDAVSYIWWWFCLDRPPTTAHALVAVARAMAAMCPPDKFQWLSDRVLNGVTKFPKPLELRRICTVGPGAIAPKDGREVEDVRLEDIANGE
jgi:hypothetical protein